MKKIECSDAWDYYIGKYCTSEEKTLLMKLNDNEYSDIEDAYADVYNEIKRKLIYAKSKYGGK